MTQKTQVLIDQLSKDLNLTQQEIIANGVILLNNLPSIIEQLANEIDILSTYEYEVCKVAIARKFIS